MWKPKILILLFATLFSFQCVETLISVRIFPNGEYFMRIQSEGDRTDILNDDFILPKDNGWVAEITERKKSDSDEPVFILETQALLKGKTIFHQKSAFFQHFLKNILLTKAFSKLSIFCTFVPP